MKSRRFRRASAKHAAHAANMRKAGWTEYRWPLAPEEDGARKVVWQSQSRRRLFDIFALVYWGVENAHGRSGRTGQVYSRAPGPPRDSTDRRENRADETLEGYGSHVLDIRLLVFNLGRADFRSKHTTPSALLVQGTTYSAIDSQVVCMESSFAMFRSLGALLDLRAIITLLEALLQPTAYARPIFQKEHSLDHGQNVDCT